MIDFVETAISHVKAQQRAADLLNSVFENYATALQRYADALAQPIDSLTDDQKRQAWFNYLMNDDRSHE